MTQTFQICNKSKSEIESSLVYERLKAVFKSERELDLLIQTVRIFSVNVGMKFGLDKCAVLVLKRGKIT